MKLSQQNIVEWGRNIANWLPVIQWSGWAIVTYLLAKLFWLLALHITSSDVSIQKVAAARANSSQSSSSNVDVNKLVQKHLFGDLAKPAEKPVEVQAARETRLNLTLRGTYAADNTNNSNSIIEDGKGKQEVYFIGDKLKVAGRVYLRQVYLDKVILETNGVMEELRLKDTLPREPKSASRANTVTKSSKARVDDKRQNKQITESLNRYKKQFQEDPLSLVGLVNYKPKLDESGNMLGIEISPGKDKRLFTQLGLRRRDIITSVNGVSLTNPQDAMQLLTDIQSMQELQVEINRGNESVSLMLNLNAGANQRRDSGPSRE
jgi:general secretion pathway protein C